MPEKNVILILPLAAQNGIDEYDGVMSHIGKHRLAWNIRLERLSPCYPHISLGDFARTDGAIIDGESSLRLQKAAVAARIPLIGIDWRHRGIAAKDTNFVPVNSDDALIGRTAAETLLENHPQAAFACLPGADDIAWSARRLHTYVETLARAGLRATVLDPKSPLGPQLRQLPKPAAVFAVTDAIAAAVLSAAAGERIRVPEDLSVLGVDNDRFICVHMRPTLASVQPDFFEGGRLAAEALDNLLNGRPCRPSLGYGIKGVVLRRSLEPPGTAGQIVQNARELIRDGNVASVDDLASRLKVSRRLLDRRFREIEGRSVLDCIQDIRIERAKRLLDTTALPIREIARQFAFSSPTYLNRLFRLKTGLTMTEYRRR